MALYQNDYGKGVKQLPVSREADGVCSVDFVIDFAELATLGITLADGDKFEIGGIPGGHTPVDFLMVNDDLDSDGSPALDFDIGIMSGTYQDPDSSRTVGDEFFDGSTVGQSAGVARGALASGLVIAASASDRGIGVLFNAAPATQPATGELRFRLQYKQ